MLAALAMSREKKEKSFSRRSHYIWIKDYESKHFFFSESHAMKELEAFEKLSIPVYE